MFSSHLKLAFILTVNRVRHWSVLHCSSSNQLTLNFCQCWTLCVALIVLYILLQCLCLCCGS